MPPASSTCNLPRLDSTPSRPRCSRSHDVTLAMTAVSRALSGRTCNIELRIRDGACSLHLRYLERNLPCSFASRSMNYLARLINTSRVYYPHLLRARLLSACSRLTVFSVLRHRYAQKAHGSTQYTLIHDLMRYIPTCNSHIPYILLSLATPVTTPSQARARFRATFSYKIEDTFQPKPRIFSACRHVPVANSKLPPDILLKNAWPSKASRDR